MSATSKSAASVDLLAPGSTAKSGLAHRLYHGETSFEFVRRWKLWLTISGTVIIIGLLALGFRGLNEGIDFKGGTVWELKTNGVSVAKARDAMTKQGFKDTKVQVVGNNRFRIQATKTEGPQRDKVSEALAKLTHLKAQDVSVSFVGPSWGKDVSKKAQKALVVFFILITLYIALRFEWKMALAAIIAVIHDILVTVGIYALSGLAVTPATVIAFLTILGYSLYDTIVVFDKVEENVKGQAGTGRMSYTDLVNLSMNQVLMRSINTSLVAIMPVASMLVFGYWLMGATALGDFGLALFIGLLTGAYSSIFVASPLLAVLKEREPKYAQIRARLGGGGALGGLSPAGAAAARRSVAAVGGPAVTVRDGQILRPGQGAVSPSVESTIIQPRPRKKGR